jgi:hypothetical protein
MTGPEPLRRLIRMPGIAALEDRLLLDTLARDNDLYEFKAMCGETLFSLFGIWHQDTLFARPDNYEAMDEDARYEIQLQAEAWEEQFVTEGMKWDEVRLPYLKTLGWDLTNHRGQALNITKYVCRIVEAVAKNIAGQAPDGDVIDVQVLEDRLKRQVADFQQKTKSQSLRGLR